MSDPDPFFSGEALPTIVKNMERRWGLTLVSFLPPEAQDNVVTLQGEISKLCEGCSNVRKRRGSWFFEFYQARHLHCTHLTLTRSTPLGPVKAGDFVRPNHNLSDLLKTIHDITSHVKPIKAELHTLVMSPSGIEIVLLGKCADDSVESRTSLLKNLNETLPNSFKLSRRSWGADPSEYSNLHCCLGFLKRPVPQGHAEFVSGIRSIEFEHFSFTLESIELLHHRYRSISCSEGKFIFPLGEKMEIKEEKEKEFVSSINMIE